jgi:hypothetical protein
MVLHCLENRIAAGYTTFGSIWDRGEVTKPSFSLTGCNGESIPVQNKVTARWPDGSVKWAAHTANSALMGKTVTIIPVEDNNISSQPVLVNENDQYYIVNTGKLKASIPCTNSSVQVLVENIILNDKSLITKAYPVIVLERRRHEGTSFFSENTSYQGQVNSVSLEENGPLFCVFRFEGIHIPDDSVGCFMPFVTWLYFYHDSTEIRCVHTWFYDGREERDYLKGMGICFEAALEGEAYNRHIQFATDQGRCFHEAAVIMNSTNPRLPLSVLESQMSGKTQRYSKDSMEAVAANSLPVWNRYSLTQDSPSHFLIRKQVEENCCAIDCVHGRRAHGVVAVHGSSNGIMLAMKDFWQKYPSGFEVCGLNDCISNCTSWFYSPAVEAYDFRHYTTKSYPQSSYEGFEEVGASAYGISVTNECTLSLLENFPDGKSIYEFAQRIQKPPVYIGIPEYYHEKKAFGFWSLKRTDTEIEKWIEQQLEKAVGFHIKEVENRNWYGLFNYGDIMHTYDKVRHTWRYDMGGYAWQNTELVPTYWLWLYFLRTSREDVYTLAEAMSRHCSDVDFYHFGPMKGIGSRHNVRHWGCSCKEPRISMAGHHRFYYYLTGDHRIGDAMDDAADADLSMINCPHFIGKNKEGNQQLVIRSGPDWSSFVSNWMTKYERSLDNRYRQKIETGINDLNHTPFGLASGPDYIYDSAYSHLIYTGENDTTGNMHLQICMGGPQVWLETAYMLNSEALKKMLADHGRFYFLSKEEKSTFTNGLIVNRPFSLPYFAAGLGAYSAFLNKNKDLAELVWKILLKVLKNGNDEYGFQTNIYTIDDCGKAMEELTWVSPSGLSTNYLTQWCLNVIIALDFIRDYLPKNLIDLG